MSKTVDERVVSMQFDNARFERNVQQSKDSLERLNKSFEKTEAAGYKSGLQISDMWRKAASVFEYQVANRIVAAAKNITNAFLGITATKAGFNEYELKMGSIQTIMASTGESLETVNGYLNELNEYSDKTIYSFSDMTQNIGKFTNAGVSLEKSVKAIQGVANVAAVSGANANEASRAMYNFSQALSAGYVKLIDWKSIENANMATKEFKQQLIDSAVAAGTLTKTGDDMYKTLNGTVINATKNFNDSLQDQWMTSEVLITTLGKYTDATTEIGQKAIKAATEVKTFTQLMDTLKESAQSGWAQTWEILIGDFDEAKNLLSGINDVVGGFLDKTAKTRNELLGQWKALGGRTDLIKGLANVCSFLGDILKSIGEAFRDIFPPMSAHRLAEITKGFREFTENLKMGEGTYENVAHTFRGLFAIVDILVSLFGGAFRTVFKAANAVLGAFGLNVFDITANIANGIIKVRNWIKEHDPIVAVFSRIGQALKQGIDGLRDWIEELKGSDNIPRDIIKGLINGFAKGASSVVNAVINIGKQLIDGIKNLLGIHSPSTVFFEIGQNIVQGFVKGIEKGMSLIGKAFDGIANFTNKNFGTNAFENISKLALSGGLILFAVKFGKFVSSIAKPVEAFSECVEDFGIAAKNFGKGFKSLAKGVSINLKSEAFLNAAKAIAILAASVIALTMIEPGKLWTAVGAIAALTAVMAAVVFLLGKMDDIKLKKGASEVTKNKAQLLIIGVAFVAIAGAILLMAAAVKKLGEMSTGDLVKGMAAMVLVCGFLKTFARMVSGTMNDAKVFKQFRKMFTSFALSLILMVAAIKLIGMLDANEIGKGLAAITMFSLFIVGLTAVSRLAGKGDKVGSLAKFMTALGGALVMMAITMKIIGGMKWESLGKAVVGMAVLTVFITALIAATNLANKNETKIGRTMLALAGSMLLLGVAIRIIGGISWGGLAKAALGMGLLTAFMVGLIAATKLANQSKVLTDGAGGKIVEKTTVGRTILALAGAMALMAVALRLIGGMEWDALGKGVVGVSVLSVFILGLVKALGKPGTDKKIGRIGSTVMQLGVAMIAMALAMKIIGNIDVASLIKGTAAIVIMGAMFTKLTEATSKLKGLQMKTVVALTVAIGVLATAIGVLSIIKPSRLASSTAALSGIMLVFMAMVEAFSRLKIDPKTITKKLIAIGILTGIVAILATTIGLLSTVKPERAMGSAAALSALLLALSGSMTIISKVADIKLKTLGKFAILTGIIAILGAVVAGLSHITNPSKAIASAVALSALLLAMSVTLEILGKMSSPSVKAVGTLGLLALIVAGLGGILIGMSYIKNPSAAIGSAVALTVLLAALTGAVQVLKTMNKIAVAGLASLAIVTLIVVALAGVLYALKDLNPNQAMGIVGSLSVMLLAMTTTLLLIQFVGGQATLGVLLMVPLLLIMDYMGELLKSLSGLDPDQAISVAKSLSTMLLAMSAACLILTVVGLGGPAAIIGVASLMAVVYSLGGFLTAIGALTEKFPQLEEFLDKGIPILEKIGNALGSFFGNIVGGFLEGVSSALPRIGQDLSDFMNNARDFIDGASKIDASVGDGMASLAKAIIVLTAANLLEGITRFFTGGSSLADFGEEIADFAPNLKKFADETKDIDPERVTAAADAAKAIAEMTNTIPNSGGVVSWFAGDNSITSFANELETLGEGIASFARETEGVSPDKVTAAANAAKIIAEMTEFIPNEGGVVSWFAGDNSISKFSDELEGLGEGVSKFANKTSGVKPEAVVAAANAAKTIAEMTNTIPNEGGVVSWFAGENSISKFSGELEGLGDGISKFANKTSGVKPEAIVAAAKAAESIANMTETIPNEGGVVAWFAGENSISKFASELPGLGDGIKGFGDAVVGLVPENVTTAAKAAESIAALTEVIPKEGGIKAWFTGETSVSKFSDKLPGLGAGIKGFGDAVQGIVPANVEAAANAAKAIAEITKYIPEDASKLTDFGSKLGDFGNQMKSYFLNIAGISADSMTAAEKALAALKKINEIDINQIESATSAVKDFVKAVNSMAKDIEDDFGDAGKEAIEAFVDAIEDGVNDAEDACESVLDACIDALDDCSSDFESAGKQVVTGFASGISENTYAAEAKARAMAKAAARAAENALEIKSPSRVFYTIGDFAGMGFIKGLSGYEDASYDAGTNMAESARSGLASAIGKIKKLINGGMDMQPTIRPVLDLSNVKAGANMLNDVFGSNRTVGVMTNVGAISASMSGYGQNGSNDDVVSEIKKLRKDMSNVGNTTNIIEGITYDDGSNINEAVSAIVRAARMERRV